VHLTRSSRDRPTHPGMTHGQGGSGSNPSGRTSPIIRNHHHIHGRFTGALCPMRARGLDRGHRLAAKLQVSMPTREGAAGPSQGGSAGSNPVGATNHHQHNTAYDLEERRSGAMSCVRRRPVKSGCGRVSVPYSCPRSVPVSTSACPSAASTRRRTSASLPSRHLRRRQLCRSSMNRRSFRSSRVGLG
jgi:hypothetical protein